MYKYYDITLNGNEEVTLTYELEQHRPAQIWAHLMSQAHIDTLRPTLFPWQDFDRSMIAKRIARIEQLVVDLNQWLPENNKIIGTWNHSDYQGSVNRLHVHFPEQEKTEKDPVRRMQLSEYNDLIHEIEMMTTTTPSPKPRLLICPDGYDYIPLEGDDYKLFKARRFFGELCLHYCHVGRHPYELYVASDYECPVEQIVPQHSITTFHTLRFYDDEFMEHWNRGRFLEFYNRSTLKNVVNINDPKMAFGYITMGKLVSSNSKEKVLESVNNCNKIIAWKLY